MNQFQTYPISTSNSGLTYFEIQRNQFINAPFASKNEREEFQISLKDWKKYCSEMQLVRRTNYLCGNEFKDLSGIAKTCIQKKIFIGENSRQVDFYLWKGDITTLEIDAVVNAANETLLGGGGVDEAIHKGAGPLLVKECAYLDGCEVGETKITKGYKLPALYVLHTVGPLLNDSGSSDPKMLASCYSTSLDLCCMYQLNSVAFPCIATGFYGFPNDQAAEVAVKTAISFVNQNKTGPHSIIFAVFTAEQEKAYLRAFELLK